MLRYVFKFSFYYSPEHPERPWLDGLNEDETVRLEHAYKSVITLTLEIEELDSNGELSSKNNITSGFYDALLLYAYSLNSLINQTSAKANLNKKINNFDVVSEIRGRTFPGRN